MKNILTLILTLSYLTCLGQTVLTVHQDTIETNIPVLTIDSITFNKTYPKRLQVIQIGGNVLTFVTNTIDSITHTVTSGSGDLPIITTIPAYVSMNYASFGGYMIYEGSSPVTERGIVWSESPNPTLADSVRSRTHNGFVFSLNTVVKDTTYYGRAFATNSFGTAYGNQITFTPNVLNQDLTYGSVTDIDGNRYATLVYGGKEWMAENLKTTKYANGDTICSEFSYSDSLWRLMTIGGISYPHDGRPWNQLHDTYGLLYNYYAVQDSRNICPAGWHVPTRGEWMDLLFAISPTTDTTSFYSDNLIQDLVKTRGNRHWTTYYPNLSKNISGFSVLPAGYRSGDDPNAGGNDPGYNGLGYYSCLWTSTCTVRTPGNPCHPYSVKVSIHYLRVEQSGLLYTHTSAGSVRCIRD